jgi:hypothetical protein
MQAIGPVKPTAPTGGVQDRQVVSLQDRVSSKIEQESHDRKKSRQNETEDTTGGVVPTSFLPSVKELPRLYVTTRLHMGVEPHSPVRDVGSLFALSVARRGSLHGTGSEITAPSGAVEENGPAHVQRSDGEQAETAPRRHVATHVDKAAIVTSEAPNTPTVNAKLLASSMSAIAEVNIDAETGTGVRAGAGMASMAAPGENGNPLVRDTPGMDGVARQADTLRAIPLGDRKSATAGAVEDLSADFSPTTRQTGSSFEQQPSFQRPTTQTKGNTTSTRATRADAGGAFVEGQTTKATKAGPPELTYRFQSWGDGHAVRAQIASQGAVMLNPTSMRVNEALNFASTDSGEAPAWRIDAADASGDDDSNHKRRQR